jgi:hypothetical protein
MDWVAYFVQNARDRVSIPWEHDVAIESHLFAPLVRSLQRFQVGEQGEGTHLKRAAIRTGDVTYSRAIALFVEEERHHAYILARILDAMGGSVLRWHWSDACFICLRRRFGLHAELLVLLAAEIIGERFYRIVYTTIDDHLIHSAFGQILRDEEGHIAFHSDYLRHTLPPSACARVALHLGWRILFRIACLVVIFDHRSFLRAAGVSPISFWRRCGQRFDTVALHILGAPQLSPRTPASVHWLNRVVP